MFDGHFYVGGPGGWHASTALTSRARNVPAPRRPLSIDEVGKHSIVTANMLARSGSIVSRGFSEDAIGFEAVRFPDIGCARRLLVRGAAQ